MLNLLFGATLVAPADLVIENARIWTDQGSSFARFAAVANGRFIYVGEPKREYIGRGTSKVDARGAVVIPGLIDAHAHMLNGARSLDSLNLRPAKNKDEFIGLVKDWAATRASNDWIIGHGWSAESWPDQTAPRKEWLDAITGGRPAVLRRMDGHSCVVNSAALKLAGITKTYPATVPGGVIDRDANGEPTGMLRENAMGLVSALVPTKPDAERLRNLKNAIRHANSNGITSVCDIGSVADLPLYRRLATERTHSLRHFFYATSTDWSKSIQTVKGFQGKPGWVEAKGFKAYMDGSLGSHTAYMRQPFSHNPADKPDWRGVPMPGAIDGTYAKSFDAASKANLQAIVHAIGDEGNHLLLNLLQQNVPDIRNARARSEHAQHLLPNDIKRFAELGVIASMQPYHKADDGRYAEQHIGAERCHSSYAYRMLLDAGAKLAFGSDWPVVDINPFLGMEAAVTGRILTGKVWEPQNRITVDEAMRAYTSGAAYACFEEKEIGRISPGYRADFVVLNRSPWEPGIDWSRIKPMLVYVEGRLVYYPTR